MLAIIIISLFLLLVLAIIIIEIRNEKAYQEKRRQKHQNTKESLKPKSLNRKKTTKKTDETSNKVESTKQTPQKDLPKCNYPKFTHIRLIEMGLSDEEAKEFVQELIPQIEEQIPLIEKSLKDNDFHQMERLTHSIKGSATNLGTGGISDLLVECNTYLKTGTDTDIANAYFTHLIHYTKALKKQYT